MAFQSLYRRYRPRRFEEVRGQEHVMRALRNAVRDGTVAHAYLFSGPRGTGKTSTARILAKALNCDAPVDGEPDGTCESCLAVEAGRSLDVVELDAASNNGVEAMRDLVARVALGSGGRAKVYIVDEVHMLSTAASNALLKTLEEPPAHVTFVLATTDPQKVLPTIRSRTQHFEFRLLAATTLEDHLRWVAADAGLDVADDALALAARRGKGSARDALSALDQIVAAGGEADEDTSLDELTEALCERDTGRALAAVALSCNSGRDPRQLAEALLGHLRDALLAVLAPDVVSLPDEAMEQVADQGRRLGAPATVRALDAVGEALLAMREAPDPRVALEVSLVRVTRPELDTSPAALVERLERLERAGRAVPAAAPAPAPTASAPAPAAPAAPASPAPAAPAPADDAAAVAAPSTRESPAAAAREAMANARPALGALKRQGATPPPPAPAAPAPAAASPAPAPTAPAAPSTDMAPGGDLALEAVQAAWPGVLGQLRPVARARFASGSVTVDGGTVVLGFETEAMRVMAAEMADAVTTALAAALGTSVTVRLTVTGGSRPAASPGRDDAPPPEEEAPDLSDLRDAPADDRTGIDHLTSAFPGAEVLDEGS